MVDATLVIRGENRSDAAFRSANSSMAKLTKRVSGLALAYGALRVTQKVIDIHKKFTATISDLSAITGATGKQLEFLRKKSLQYGETTTLTASQAAEAFKLVASAKPDLLQNADALARVTKQSIILAEASGSTLPEAAITLTLAMNQYGASADQAGRFINVLAAGAKFGASEIAATAAALKNSGLVARSAGTSFEELNAIIQVLAKSGIKAEEAGVGIRNIFLNLAIQTNDKFKPSVVGFTHAIKNMKAANLSTTELLKIFGKKNIVAAKAVIQHANALDGLTKKLTGTNTALDQSRTKVNNLSGDLKKLKSQWEGVSLTLGEELNPQLRLSAQVLGWLSKVAKAGVIAFSSLFDAIGANAAAVEALISGDIARIRTIMKQREVERLASQERIKNLFVEKISVEALDAAKLSGARALSAAQAAGARPVSSQGGGQSGGLSEKDNKIIESLRLRMMTEREIEIARFEQKAQDIRDWHELNRIDALEFDARIEENKRAHEQRLTQIKSRADATRAKNSKKWDMLKLKSATATATQQLGAFAGTSKKMFKLHKTLALAQAVISLPSAVLKAIDNGGGLPWGAIPGAITLAAGLAQIRAIKSSSFGGGGGAPSFSSGGGGGSSAAGGNPPALPGGQQRTVTDQVDGGSVNIDPRQREVVIMLDKHELGRALTDMSSDGLIEVSESSIQPR